MKYALFTLLGLFVSSMAVGLGSAPPTTPTLPRPSAPAQVKKLLLQRLRQPSSGMGGNLHSTNQEASSLQGTGSPTDTNSLITDFPTTPQ
jgi:hypothetical protein